ncbi:hypothetical protein EKO29_07715 [Colwellia sp. Arc7-635]|uniref:PKD domain-containing protein n=1 Tax=Colwellia sp. Arc7-635 TaxID=2497879 RepID=UPI000F859208|nr:PKD domain-containing protein [Colwellia sp. Arc7-635]AZQ83917.1 hypothetical protein EKO29_07715 [Colwellia sp. Arc7-635]
MFNSFFRRSITIFTVFTLIGCGGGGDSSTSTSPNIPSPTSPPQSSNLIKPSYTGESNTKSITTKNANHLAFDLTLGFDMLHVISFSDVYEQFFIYSEEDPVSSGSSDINCISGSASINEVSSTHLSVKYDQCAQGGIIADGILDIYVVRAYSSELVDMDIVPNLSMVDKASSESIDINGYIKVRQSTVPSFQHKATYQILLTNEKNNQLYFNDFSAQVSLRRERYGIDYSGEILSTEYGKLSIETTKLYDSNNLGFDLTVSAENTMLISVLLRQQLTVNIDSNTIPLIIDLNNIPQSFFDDINEEPQAVLNTSVTSTSRADEVVISATNSSDPDLDLLEYQWTVINSPANAVWNIGDGAAPNFSANVPGDYTIQLTVVDAQGLTSVVTVVITLEKLAPEFTIEMDTPTSAINTITHGQAVLSSDELDGPFKYHIVYGPYGMTIDENGQIQWPAHILDFGVSTDVNFSVAVSNDDKTTSVASTMSITSDQNLIESRVFKDIENILPSVFSNYEGVITHQSKEHFISSLNYPETFSSRIFLNENNDVDIELAKKSLPQGYGYFTSYDVNSDGALDHFLVSEDYTGSDPLWHLWLEDGLTGSRSKVITMNGHRGSFTGLGHFYFNDIDNDGEVEMTISTSLAQGSLRKIRSYNLSTFELENTIETIDGEYVGYCDIDQDGFTDVVTNKEIYSLRTGELIDTVGDNYQDIKLLKTGDSCLLLSYDYMYKFENGSLRTTRNELKPIYFIGNFDSDIDQEIILFEENLNEADQWFLVNIDSNGNTSKSELSVPENMFIVAQRNSPSSLTVFAAFDIDGDGVDELVAYVSYEGNEIQTYDKGLTALSLQGNRLIEKYSGAKVGSRYDGFSRIAQYHDDNTVTVNTSDGAIKLDDDQQWVDFDNSTGWSAGNILATEVVNNELFYYASLPVPYTNGIAKYDNTGSMLWSNQINDLYVYTEVEITNDKLLVNNTGSSYIVNKNDGEFIDATFGHLIASPRHLSTQKFLDKDAYLFYQLDNGQLSTVLSHENYEFWGNGLNIPINADVQFIQYDQDEQVEVVFDYYTLNDEGSNIRKYEIVDSLYWTKEVLKPGLSGNQSEYFIGQELKSCIIADTHCRNRIVLWDGHLEIRDKLTSEIIYQSPTFPGMVQDLAIKPNINGSISYSLLLLNGVTVYH